MHTCADPFNAQCEFCTILCNTQPDADYCKQTETHTHTHAHFKSNLSNVTTMAKYGQRTLLPAFLIISFVYYVKISFNIII